MRRALNLLEHMPLSHIAADSYEAAPVASRRAAAFGAGCSTDGASPAMRVHGPQLR